MNYKTFLLVIIFIMIGSVDSSMRVPTTSPQEQSRAKAQTETYTQLRAKLISFASELTTLANQLGKQTQNLSTGDLKKISDQLASIEQRYNDFNSNQVKPSKRQSLIADEHLAPIDTLCSSFQALAAKTHQDLKVLTDRLQAQTQDALSKKQAKDAPPKELAGESKGVIARAAEKEKASCSKIYAKITKFSQYTSVKSGNRIRSMTTIHLSDEGKSIVSLFNDLKITLMNHQLYAKGLKFSEFNDGFQTNMYSPQESNISFKSFMNMQEISTIINEFNARRCKEDPKEVERRDLTISKYNELFGWYEIYKQSNPKRAYEILMTIEAESKKDEQSPWIKGLLQEKNLPAKQLEIQELIRARAARVLKVHREYTKHATERMEERKISEEEIKEIIATGRKLRGRGGEIIYVEKENGGNPLKVIVDPSDKVIITVFRQDLEHNEDLKKQEALIRKTLDKILKELRKDKSLSDAERTKKIAEVEDSREKQLADARGLYLLLSKEE